MNTKMRILTIFLALLMTVSLFACDTAGDSDETTAASDETTADSTAQPEELVLYVSPDGSDENDGAENAPFATITGARDAIRKLDKTKYTGITVLVGEGEYHVSDGIVFTGEDSGTESCPITYKAVGRAVLNGGYSIPADSLKKIEDEAVKARLSEEARENVLCVNLADLHINVADCGNIHAVGVGNTADKYDGDYSGTIACELFQNDTRMTLARYPNDFTLRTEEVVSEGFGYRSSYFNPDLIREEYLTTRNPESDVYKINDELAEHIASWATLDDVWMYGYWMHDWADASTPIGFFDAEKKELSPKFVSSYGARSGTEYYFFNVFEELDVPGEWYLDRTTGMLYLYPDGEIEDLMITVTENTLLTASGVNYFTLDGLEFCGTRTDAINYSGSHSVIRNCLIKNIAGRAIIMSGSDDLIQGNEITHTGRSAITVSGGDMTTLTPGNMIVDNNYIHDWSEVYQTYQMAVDMYGVGNVCSHNEICNSPHTAISYNGCNHIVEYNDISKVCQRSTDAGAIYTGRRWDNYGSVIRYNRLTDIGNTIYRGNGIYLDDAMSGQSVYGNILTDVYGISILIGGGRDLYVCNNIIMQKNNNSREFDGIHYDQRARDGVINDGWFEYSREGGDMWQMLYDSPYKSEIWQKAFPAMANFSDDFSDPDNPNFVPNPANSIIKGNIVLGRVNPYEPLGDFDLDEVSKQWNDVSENVVIQYNSIKSAKKELQAIFIDYENGDFTVREDAQIRSELPENYENIPISQIGRYEITE